MIAAVTKVAKSNAMEKAGFVTLLDCIMSKGIKVPQTSTDRHNQIRKLMQSDPKN